MKGMSGEGGLAGWEDMEGGREAKIGCGGWRAVGIVSLKAREATARSGYSRSTGSTDAMRTATVLSQGCSDPPAQLGAVVGAVVVVLLGLLGAPLCVLCSLRRHSLLTVHARC
eukprot:290061-Chlamydomonas_euryale.AAC.1